MEKVILIHGSGHKAASWNETVSRLDCRGDVLCPELSSLLLGKEASYPNLRAAFGAYCAQAGGPVHLCGLSWRHFGPGLHAGAPGGRQNNRYTYS